ncbi:SDR family oxidoreductase [Streptomyces sp. MAR4 CNX-425]|uniref:SDR family oxidoreductase n=1 Tax=Streptomyces sp. MAR4 CNX-425 TaxID=3406343 RepID=UPI003B50CAC5
MPIEGRNVLVTGVSRTRGIGFAIARRLADDGARLFVHGWPAHDDEMSWGSDLDGTASVVAALGGDPERIDHAVADLARPDAPAALLTAARERHGMVDTLVVNHARSSPYGLERLTAAELDLCWAVNVRATLLLVQEYAAQYDPAAGRERGGGRVVLFTSGQHLAPMSGEIPYAATKGALQQLTLTLSDALVDRGITVNCVNPGPTDTGWADAELTAQVGRALPRGRWNTPDEAAAVVRLLLGDDAATITGNTVDAESGFRRWVH